MKIIEILCLPNPEYNCLLDSIPPFKAARAQWWDDLRAGVVKQGAFLTYIERAVKQLSPLERILYGIEDE